MDGGLCPLLAHNKTVITKPRFGYDCAARPYGPQMNNSELVQMVEEMLGPEAAAFFIPNTMTEKESQAMMDFSLSWIARHPMDAHLVTKVLLL